MQLIRHEWTYPLWLKGEPDNGAPDLGQSEDLLPELDRGDGDRKLVCRVCRSVITRPDLGMAVNGNHKHVFFNPYGMVFELGCFASAKNVVPAGPRSGEFTWFPGYEWQVVACTGCASQLGWRYTGQDGGFYGLILKSLIEEEGRKA